MEQGGGFLLVEKKIFSRQKKNPFSLIGEAKNLNKSLCDQASSPVLSRPKNGSVLSVVYWFRDTTKTNALYHKSATQ